MALEWGRRKAKKEATISIIAFDGKQVAWDSCVSRGRISIETIPNKMIVRRVGEEEFLIGGVGVVAEIFSFQSHLKSLPDPVFLDWFENCEQYKTSKDTCLVVFRPSQSTFLYFEKSKRIVTTAKQNACGSGEEFVLGALAAGASAKRAVEIACDRVAYVARPVNVYPAERDKRSSRARRRGGRHALKVVKVEGIPTKISNRRRRGLSVRTPL